MLKKIRPIHPGHILEKEFLEPLGITKYRIAKDIAVSPIRISEIIGAKRAISVDTAMRLARYFGTSAEFWLRLQMRYDIERQSDVVLRRITKNVKVFETQNAS